MNTFLGVFRYEYRMSTRRVGFWLAFLLLGGFTAFERLSIFEIFSQGSLSMQKIWQLAGTFAWQLNLLLPVVGGIVLADRVVRDDRLGVRELLSSAPLPRWTYILGKYFGSLFSVLTPVFLITGVYALIAALQSAPPELFPALLVAFLAINVPAYAFIAAFSLACPLVMPVRVYQILFTGYWFWGNYLSPDVMPTLNGTLLTASGEFALFGFFGGWVGLEPGQLHTATQAALNLGLLALCALIAMVGLERFLAWRARQA